MLVVNTSGDDLAGQGAKLVVFDPANDLRTLHADHSNKRGNEIMRPR